MVNRGPYRSAQLRTAALVVLLLLALMMTVYSTNSTSSSLKSATQNLLIGEHSFSSAVETSGQLRKHVDGVNVRNPTTDSSERAQHLSLRRTSVCNKAKEGKTNGGEDAWFVSTSGTAVGVADGVGGWSFSGVDAGLFSRHLMKETRALYDTWPQWNGKQPAEIISQALRKVKARGSATVSLVTLTSKGLLELYSLGDSTVLLVRDETIFYESKEQWHEFNTPYQVGGDVPDSPRKGILRSVNALPGDVILIASDGIWDNLWPKEVLEVLVKKGVDDAACQIVDAASRVAKNTSSMKTPFAVSAAKYGYQFPGGKDDDMTVVLTIVQPDDLKVTPRVEIRE